MTSIITITINIRDASPISLSYSPEKNKKAVLAHTTININSLNNTFITIFLSIGGVGGSRTHVQDVPFVGFRLGLPPQPHTTPRRTLDAFLRKYNKEEPATGVEPVRPYRRIFLFSSISWIRLSLRISLSILNILTILFHIVIISLFLDHRQ